MASPAPAPGGRKILGLKPRTALIAGGVILAGAVAYFWWKRKQTPAQTSASASASAGAYSTAAQLEAMQEELDELMSSSASTGAGSGGGSTGTGTTTTGTGTGTGTTTTGTGTTTTTAPGPPGVQPGGPIATTPPPAKTAPAKTAAPAMPTGVRATKVTATSITISWTKVAGATFYPIRVTYQGKVVRTSGTAGTTATIFGLTPDHTYTIHVKAQGPGGTSSETNGPAVKTSL